VLNPVWWRGGDLTIEYCGEEGGQRLRRERGGSIRVKTYKSVRVELVGEWDPRPRHRLRAWGNREKKAEEKRLQRGHRGHGVRRKEGRTREKSRRARGLSLCYSKEEGPKSTVRSDCATEKKNPRHMQNRTWGTRGLVGGIGDRQSGGEPPHSKVVSELHG